MEEGEFDDGALRDGVGDVEVVGDLEDANGRKPTMKSEKKKMKNGLKPGYLIEGVIL